MGEIIRYAAAGVVNTLVGYGVFLAMLHLLELSPQAANAVGYAAGLAVAFALNRFLVFKVANISVATALRFGFSFAIAFVLNQVVLVSLVRCGLPAEIAQIAAMTVYTVLFYLMNRFFVFVG